MKHILILEFWNLFITYLKVTVSTIFSDFLNRNFSPKFEQMWITNSSKTAKNTEKRFSRNIWGKTCSQAICVWATLIHFKYFIDKSIGLDNRLCLYRSSLTTRWNNLNTIYIRHRALYPSCIHAIHLNYQA